MAEHELRSKPEVFSSFHGRTYTLTDHLGDSNRYYNLVRDLADRLLESTPGEAVLREKIRAVSTWKGFFKVIPGTDRQFRKILRDLDNDLTTYLTGVEEHLLNLSLTDRLDRTIRTSKEQYICYMLEIELANRINRENFLKAPWRMALIAHCLRDFRNSCRSVPGDIEEECTHCQSECQVNLGSALLRQFQINPYISVSMDHHTLFKQLGRIHPEMGVLGIACVPELVMGMRLCEKLNIPAVGVPLDANRCSRWLGECKETTFNLEELERLIKPVPETGR